MTGLGRLHLVDLMPVEAAMRVEQIALSWDAIEIVGPRRLERVQMLAVLADAVGNDRSICALEKDRGNVLSFVDDKVRGTRIDLAALSGSPASPALLYDTLLRYGNQIVMTDAPSPPMLTGLRSVNEGGCTALWVGVEQQGTIPTAALVLEVGYDQACRRVWTSEDGLLYSV